jgi:hypothetical protein
MSHVFFHDKLGTADLLLLILYLKYCGHLYSARTRSQWMWRHWMGKQMCSLSWIPSYSLVAIWVNASLVAPTFWQALIYLVTVPYHHVQICHIGAPMKNPQVQVSPICNCHIFQVYTVYHMLLIINTYCALAGFLWSFPQICWYL